MKKNKTKTERALYSYAGSSMAYQARLAALTLIYFLRNRPDHSAKGKDYRLLKRLFRFQRYGCVSISYRWMTHLRHLGLIEFTYGSKIQLTELGKTKDIWDFLVEHNYFVVA